MTRHAGQDGVTTGRSWALDEQRPHAVAATALAACAFSRVLMGPEDSTEEAEGPGGQEAGDSWWRRGGWASAFGNEPGRRRPAWADCLKSQGSYVQAGVQSLQRRARRRAGRAGREDANLALAEGGAVVDFVAARALAHGLSAAVDTVLLQEGHRQSVRSRCPGPAGADRVPIPATSVPSQISSSFAYMGLPLPGMQKGFTL